MSIFRPVRFSFLLFTFDNLCPCGLASPSTLFCAVPSISSALQDSILSISAAIAAAADVDAAAADQSGGSW